MRGSNIIFSKKIKKAIKLNSSTSLIIRSFKLLSQRELRNLLFVSAIQIFLAFLDLLGVIIFGLLGSLTINGISSKKAGDKTQKILDILQISGKSLKDQAMYLGILATSFLIIKTIVSLYLNKKALYFLSRRAAQVSKNLISKLLSQSLLVVNEKSVQETIYMVTNGVQTITMGVIGTIVYLISDFVLLIVILTGLLLINPLVAIMTTLMFCFVSFFLYIAMHKTMGRFGQVQNELSIISAEKINEVIISYREMFVKNRRSYYANEIGKIRLELADSAAQNAFYQNISKYVIEITIVASSLLLSVIIFSTQPVSRAVAVLSIFLVASMRIGPAVLRLQQAFLNIKSSIGQCLPTLDLIDKLNSLVSVRENNRDVLIKDYVGFIPSISMQNISFKYPNKNNFALKDLNIKIIPGTITSIVGPSGAGKTTIVDLILGVISPDKGKVYISEMSPVEVINKWPGSISYVPQDVVISNGTIRENISLGYPLESVNFFNISDAILVANIEDFVNSLPDGINTYVGDRGTKISGGQKQRLGIARSMFTKPKLLVLDEATSSLDALSEAKITESIQNMRGNVTVIMIAHRLSTVRNSDQVIYIDNGQVIANGTFDEVREKVPDFDKQAKLMGL